MSKKRKALMLASVASMIDQFNMPNIEILQSFGYQVDVVADFTNPGNISKERAKELICRLESMGARVIDIAVPRSLNLKAVVSAYRKTKALVADEHYDLIHCHSPIGGVICRLAARNERKNGTRVIYTAHGFHFYDGAPLKNWLIFYPVEKWLSSYTDDLITINQEDYKRASEHFHAARTVYIPGIGVDTERFAQGHNGTAIRKELGIEDGDCVLLSVGELNENKNHAVVLHALKKMDHPRPYYVIVGKGEREPYLRGLIRELSLEDRVMLSGFRQNVADFYDAADVFVFPSFREGLSVSLMEAMASRLPVACSKIRGNTDLIDEGEGGFFFDPSDVESVALGIQKALKSNRKELGNYNLTKMKDFDLKSVKKAITAIYAEND